MGHLETRLQICKFPSKKNDQIASASPSRLKATWRLTYKLSQESLICLGLYHIKNLKSDQKSKGALHFFLTLKRECKRSCATVPLNYIRLHFVSSVSSSETCQFLVQYSTLYVFLYGCTWVVLYRGWPITVSRKFSVWAGQQGVHKYKSHPRKYTKIVWMSTP